MKTYNVAIVGATGAVGEVLLELLEERNFPVENLYLLASERSTGTILSFKGKRITVQNLADFDFSQVNIGNYVRGIYQYDHFYYHKKLNDFIAWEDRHNARVWTCTM